MLRRSIGGFDEIADYQRDYERLISVCEEEGTMVLQDRLLEVDADIEPYRFFRRGTREYVFPKQDVDLLDDKCCAESSYSYNLQYEEQTFEFDSSLVKCKLRIEYYDAYDRPVLSVSAKSELPEKVKETIEDVF